MDESNYALVLTGAVLPGHAPESVWPALAAYFRMEPDKLTGQLLARAPLAIKQGDDLGKLQTLQTGIAGVGAEAEICALDGRPGLFVLLDNAPRGPVPRVFVEQRVQHGLWPGGLSVAEVGSNAWRPFTVAPVAASADAVPPDGFVTDESAANAEHPAGHAPTLAADHGHDLAGVATQTMAAMTPLPPGAAIHAGFWRRCAAMLIDGILVGIVLAVVQIVLGSGMPGFNAGDIRPGAIIGSIALGMLLAFAGQWLYFALFESGRAQATPGKLAMGIKVVDDLGRRIAFSRASGRYFGKIVSGLIFDIGYLLAGWTERKQALHDMMAGTLVVFRAVEPGQPLPQVRPPMPWYGWVLNGLLVLGLVGAALGFWMFAASMANLAGSALQSGSGF